MAAKDESYKALQDVGNELITKIATSSIDQNVLLAKAQEMGLVQSVQSVQTTATVTPGPQSKKEKAEQLITQVLEAVRTDKKNVDVFLQFLEDTSLSDVAAYLRDKLREYVHQHSEETMSQPSQPGSCSGSRAAEYGDQPKLQSASAYDSAFEETSNSVTQDGDAGSSQHQMAAADTTTNTSFKPLSSSAGVVHVIVEQDHTDNLVLETEDSVVAVNETQPHSQGIVSSSVPVLPEMKRIEQENKDLQAQLAEKTSSEESLKKDLEHVQVERDKIKRKLDEKEKELKAVKEEKDKHTKELETEVERLKVELKNEKENNVAEKEDYEKKIKSLIEKLKEKKNQYRQEKFRLLEEKHELEIKVQKMLTTEAEMNRRISEEKVKVAELQAKLAEQNAQQAREQSERTVEDLKRQHQEEMNAMKREHRDSIEKTKELEETIMKLRREKSKQEPDTS